jgi:hypothetical protein
MLKIDTFKKHPLLLVMAIGAIIFGGSKPPSPPIITSEGIKVVTYSAPIYGGMEISWKTTDERIKLGEDEFIVQVKERQIPSRTGWSKWKDVGRTKDLKFFTKGFWRNRDILLRVIVDKGEVKK